MKSHDSYFVHFFKYLNRYVLQTCDVDENHPSLTYLAKKLRKSNVSTIFHHKIDFLLIFMYIFNESKFLRRADFMTSQ